MRERLERFLLSLMSRKFLLAIAGAFIAYQAGVADGVLTNGELITVLAPLLTFIGVEGYADARERAAK